MKGSLSKIDFAFSMCPEKEIFETFRTYEVLFFIEVLVSILRMSQSWSHSVSQTTLQGITCWDYPLQKSIMMQTAGYKWRQNLKIIKISGWYLIQPIIAGKTYVVTAKSLSLRDYEIELSWISNMDPKASALHWRTKNRD